MVATEDERDGARPGHLVDRLLEGVELIGTGTVPERLWHKPAVAVLGMDAPATADASNVLLPRARAKVSLRLAPGQDEHDALDERTQPGVGSQRRDGGDHPASGPVAPGRTGAAYDGGTGATQVARARGADPDEQQEEGGHDAHPAISAVVRGL